MRVKKYITTITYGRINSYSYFFFINKKIWLPNKKFILVPLLQDIYITYFSVLQEKKNINPHENDAVSGE